MDRLSSSFFFFLFFIWVFFFSNYINFEENFLFTAVAIVIRIFETVVHGATIHQPEIKRSFLKVNKKRTRMNFAADDFLLFDDGFSCLYLRKMLILETNDVWALLYCTFLFLGLQFKQKKRRATPIEDTSIAIYKWMRMK